MQFVYLFSPNKYYILLIGARCCCVIWASITNLAAWLGHWTDYCAFRLERRVPHGVHSPYWYSCMICATVCLTVMPSFSDITDVSAISHRFKTDRSCTPLFHIAQYGDDVMGWELYLRRLPGLDTEWIIVHFSSKGMNHIMYLAHMDTVIWYVLLFV